jgi:hypothetical protein
MRNGIGGTSKTPGRGRGCLCRRWLPPKLADSDPANTEPLRLLVLDDVLIGLDLNNRFPLLELLRTGFHIIK